MRSKELLSIYEISRWTPDEIERSNPSLFASLKSVEADRLKASVASHFAGSSEQLRKQLANLDYTKWRPDSQRLSEWLRDSMKAQGASDSVLSEGAARAAELDRRNLSFESLTSDRPIADQPLLRQDLRRAEVLLLGRVARLPAPALTKVVDKVPTPDALTHARLAKLVRARILKDAEARALGLAASLFPLLDKNVELVKAVKKGRFPQLPKRKVTELRDLVALDERSWLRVIKQTGAVPDGVKPEDYATTLAKRVSSLYPTEALLHQVAPSDTKRINAWLKRLDPSLKKAVFRDLDTPGVSSRARKGVGAAHAELAGLVNKYPGLGIEEIVDNRSLSPASKAKRIERQIGLLAKVQRQNAGVELIALDYSPDSRDLRALKLSGVPERDRVKVLRTLKAYQRSHALTDNVADSRTLLEAGYQSATGIIRDGFDTFAANTGLDEDVARRYYDNARSTAGAVAGMMGTVLDVQLSRLLPLAVSNVGLERQPKTAYPKKPVNKQPPIDDYLRQLDGYTDLFGSQNYCACEHCQSILGPAAYFVDLMSFVESNILDKVFSASRQNHALNLKVRRADLWSLELTCRNTDEMIPTLQIVNEILENYIARQKGYTGPWTDRAKIQERVYRDTVAQSAKSFKQPFLLPLETLQIYLDHFERSWESVARALEAAPDVIARAVMSMSEGEYQLITQANTSMSFLRDLYGINFSVSGNTVQAFDSQLLLKPMGVNRQELGDLTASHFVTENGTLKLEIKAEKLTPDSVQNDVERIHGLTPSRLDRLHRLTRLYRRAPWTIGELDLVLSQLSAANLVTGITGDTPARLAVIIPIQKRFNVPVEEICALWSDLPLLRAFKDRDPLFDRLFNLQPFVQQAVKFPEPGTKFIHSAFRESGTSIPADSGLNRLLAGLHVSDQDLLQLIVNLELALGLDLASNSEADKGFNLTVTKLTLLYRHARLSEWLKLSIADLFQLIDISGITARSIQTLDDLSTLLEFYDWWRTTGFSLDDLGVITAGIVQKPAAVPDKQAIVTALVGEANAEKALEFADTLFAFEGLTEDQSQTIVKDNSAVIEALLPSGSYRLKATFDPDLSVQLVISNDIAATATERKAVSDRIKTALRNYHASEVVPTRLANKLNLSRERIDALIAIAGVDLSSTSIVLALQGGGPAAKLLELVGKLIPLTVLFRNSVYDAPALAFINANDNLLGVGDLTNITTEHIRRLSSYILFTDNSATAKFSADDTSLDPADLRSILLSFDGSTKKFVGVDAELSRVFRVEAGFVSALQPNIELSSSPLDALRKLKQCLDLAQQLGVGGESLKSMISSDYSSLAHATDALLGAFRAKYDDDTEYQKVVEPSEDRIRSRKRDALADYLLHSEFPQFKGASDLYQHFLIDVEFEGCARTTRLVSAISTLQLYVARCLMNLERDRKVPSQVYVLPESIPREEWSWRRNYRVWEANRKVFLYPENYIEPGLRDDKSQIFKELEDTLLQKEVREQNAIDGFAKYLAGFEALTNLTIAGSYLEATSTGDRLHLFGVTADDPPTFYHRTVDLLDTEHPAFGGWIKVEAQIPVRQISPVVCLGRLYVFWVDVNTRSKSYFESGESKFWGYIHKLSLSYTALRLDGTWSAPQKLAIKYADIKETSSALDTSVLVPDPLDEGTSEHLQFLVNIPWIPAIEIPLPTSKMPRYDTIQHAEAMEGYTLRGPQWELAYPTVKGGRIFLTLRNFRLAGEVDIGRNQLRVVQPPDTIPSEPQQGSTLGTKRVAPGSPSAELHDYDFYYAGTPAPISAYAGRTIAALPWRTMALVVSTDPGSPGYELTIGAFTQIFIGTTSGPDTKVATLPDSAEVTPVNGRTADAIVVKDLEQYLIHRIPSSAGTFRAHRLSSSIAEQLRANLAVDGLDGLLKTANQLLLQESEWVQGASGRLLVGGERNPFAGAYNGYMQEVFFQVPFLIADHLNSQQQFAAAQRWYHYLFDPTASESTDPPRDRNWRYVGFRGLDVPTLRAVLTNGAAIKAYKEDPFNPHAIARLRLSAYQKAIVMKYIDNLLDWGDSLFSQFTMESVNEAILLYVMAADILGDRPVELGECGEGQLSPKTYDTIKSHRKKDGSEFLLELETLSYSNTYTTKRTTSAYVADVSSARYAASGAEAPPATRSLVTDRRVASSYNVASPVTGASVSGATINLIGVLSAYPGDYTIGSALSMITQIGPAFCVPANGELRQYWDRVEDRLSKIRHCLDIDGVPRQLAPFAPEIDPRLLVRAKAAGLSLEDILSATGGNLPPYRFTYLIDKAKSYAGTVQSFGAALSSALEKKDVEELSRLRTVHEQNILNLTTQVKEREIKDADTVIAGLEKQQDLAQHKKDYYDGLRGLGLSEWERTQQIAQHTASGIHILEATYGVLAGVLQLVPDVGSPFAMKYGGSQLGTGLGRVAGATGALADVASAVSASAGMEATFHRRNQEWEFQSQLADKELKQLAKQLAGAKIRKEISEKSLAIHQKAVDQIEQVFDLYGSKFSNLGLYIWLSTTLQRLYRDAYNAAFAMARLAEQAYRFERWDDTYLLGATYWETSKAGLLAGERLLIELQNLERRFIETNFRTFEIDQSFSLSQLNPAALVTLRETGTCEFDIAEIFFDLYYPGHYRRKIRAVRMTVPCVAGPHTNVGATLSLLESHLRNEPKVGPTFVQTLPPTRTISIATSKGQNDGGMFEFSFRDERYMPFEGAGAISKWRLALPRSFRPFDYQTISDVILQVSYTAEEDELFRNKVEDNNAAIDGELLKAFKNTALARVFSLRQDFPNEFHRLLHSPAGTPVSVKLSDNHFPIYLQGHGIAIDPAKLALRTAEGVTLGSFKVSINNSERTSFPADAQLGDLPTNSNLNTFFSAGKQTELKFAIKDPGNLAPSAPPPGDTSAISSERLLDMFVYLEYRITS